jgi:TolA-binding protein
LPSNVLVERICNASVRQQVYASPNGSFSMELGSRYKTVMDASADGSGSRNGTASKNSEMGIPKRDLSNCELRASLSGFRSNVVSLMALDTFAGSMNVGSIVVERLEKVQGLTISAAPYRAPKDARQAYEKGLDARKNGNLVVAQQSFEKAVKIYPKFTNAWFQLGGILQTQNDKTPLVPPTRKPPRSIPSFSRLTSRYPTWPTTPGIGRNSLTSLATSSRSIL